MNGKTKKIIQWTAGVIFSLLIIFVILISSFEIVLYSDMSVYRKEYEKYEVLDELDSIWSRAFNSSVMPCFSII